MKKLLHGLATTFFGFMALAVMTTTAANAQPNGHPPEHQAIHELFYKDWLRLDMGTSCCNLDDCFPTIMVQRPSDGSWLALRKAAALALERRVQAGEDPKLPPLEDMASWIYVPENKLEHNARQPGIFAPRDPRDSPDGRSHACISGDTVYCAVIGTGN